MSDYKDIKGLKVRYLASDPANPELGEVWYNSTTNTAKVQAYVATGSWATGGNVNTARSTTSAGTQTANVIFGGQLSNPPYAPQSIVEEYNGSSWSKVNNYPTSVGNLSGTG